MDIIGSPTSKTVYFQGALGYNNGVYLLHDMCKYLYSKPSEGIYARSINLEDFEDEDLVKDGAKWKEARDAYEYYGVKYNGTKKYIGTHSYYPNIYARENGSGIGVEIESTDTEEDIKAKLKQDGIGASNKYYTEPTEETYSPESVTADSRLTVTQTYYEIPINEMNYGKVAKALCCNNNYWIASRYVECYNDNALFGLLLGRQEFVARTLFAGDRVGVKVVGSLRPVVTLKSSAQLELSDKATSSSTSHKIVRY